MKMEIEMDDSFLLLVVSFLDLPTGGDVNVAAGRRIRVHLH